jgi:DNA polymerase (family 10)
MQMELKKARALAERIAAELAPMCERIEIAGSIRRQRPVVGDIDLVILPKPGQLQAIKARCVRTSPQVLMDGEKNFLLIMSGNIQLDIFFARGPEPDMFAPKPGNFGSLLLCRTGSKDHNIYLVSNPWLQGARWLPYEGVELDGKIIAGETEEDVFQALGLDFIPPERRER